MTLKSSRHGGDVFSLAPSERNKILDFSININPLGLSPLGRRALLRYWEIETLRYPDVEDRDVTASLSAAYGMDKNTIALGNGATELMYTLLRFLKPKKVLVPAPAFPNTASPPKPPAQIRKASFWIRNMAFPFL